LFFRFCFSIINPMLPATIEATIIAILESLTGSAVSNAKRVMKIDMVKPMPPRKPTPMMFFHFNSAGSVHHPMATPIKANTTIPNGFPMTRPRIIPTLMECNKPFPRSFPNVIHVLANAKSGNITNATGLCSAAVKDKTSTFRHHCRTEAP